MTPKVTISLVTYNGGKYLPYLLPAIQKQSFSDWELMILDNNSADDTIEQIESFKIKHTLLKERRNIGFACAVNRIINWSQSDYVFLINQDIQLPPDTLDKLVKFMNSHPDAAAAAPILCYWDFDNLQTTEIIDTGGLRLTKSYHIYDWLQGQTLASQKLETQEVFGVSGALAIFRRTALNAVALPASNGGLEYFDENFFAYFEDADLAWRLRLAGWSSYLLADTIAYHHRTISAAPNASYQHSLIGQTRYWLGADQRRRRKSRHEFNAIALSNHLSMIKKNSFKSLTLKYSLHIYSYIIAKIMYLTFLDGSGFKGLVRYLHYRPRMINKRKAIIKLRRISTKDLQAWITKS